MGGYAVLQFARLHRDRVRAVVAAGAGSGSAPADRDTWPSVTASLAEAIRTRGMRAVAQELGQAPSRIRLKHKSPRAWQEFMDHLVEHSPIGMANTMSRYQALRPSLYDFQDELRAVTTPVLLAVGDEDELCLATNLMLKQQMPGAALWVCPNTGHAINLEEPSAFNAMVEWFLNRVEREDRAT